ncbi:lysine transporter LysE [Rhizobium sp. Root274]|uniref:LysE family translocator n=1 Tax=unclassified Rhizobium TaxID=2613769 RepID=UPI000715DC50|nr:MULTISPECIES: LysE family translocator [unclassified Rhizobium]KQW28866.1 lysine transporter LysE [Rhizobium sp. Root1240]KRD29062.1 lysine transporter LysE [Rhizobium sp. Root274]
MSNASWIVFAVASVALLAVPGRSALLVIAYALGHGKKTAFATVTGVTLGNLVAIGVALAALLLMLQMPPAAYDYAIWFGSAFIVYVAVRTWRAPVAGGLIADNDNLPEEKPLRVIAHCCRETIRNTRNTLFLVALLPQFMTAGEAFLPHAWEFATTFAILSVVTTLAYALAAGKIREFLRKHPKRRGITRASGTVLIAAGTVTAGYRKIAA